MDRDDIRRSLAQVPLQKAFASEAVTVEAVTEKLFVLADEILRESGPGAGEAQLISLKLVFDDPDEGEVEVEDDDEDEDDWDEEEDDRAEVNPHLHLRYQGATYHLWGDLFWTGKGLDGSLEMRRLKEKTELPTSSWGEIFKRAGATIPAEFERFARIAKDGGIARAMAPANALMEVEPFLRPDQLPFLRTTAGDYLVLRFDGRSGAPLDYALVIHDDFVTYPMGENLAAALRYLGATEVESWMANADEIAGVTAGYFEQTSTALDLMYEWNQWKFKLNEGSSANSEDLCREWLDKWNELDITVLRKNARCQTITAFAAARLGVTKRAVEAATEALRLPARDGDRGRHALLLLDELKAKLPADLKTLRDCLRSSNEVSGVLESFEKAAKARKKEGDHEGAYKLLMRANYDYDGSSEPQLLKQLLEAARAAGYGPVAQVLASRLEFPL